MYLLKSSYGTDVCIKEEPVFINWLLQCSKILQSFLEHNKAIAQHTPLSISPLNNTIRYYNISCDYLSIYQSIYHIYLNVLLSANFFNFVLSHTCFIILFYWLKEKMFTTWSVSDTVEYFVFCFYLIKY